MNRTRADQGPAEVAAGANRRGFTLVELLVVIAIVGLLVALLLPVIAGAVRTANEGRVSAEIQLLAQALAEFKNKFGEYPPSRIVLSETGFYPVSDQTPLSQYSGFVFRNPGSGAWVNGPLPPGKAGIPEMTVGQLAERSVRYLRKFFPNATFSTTGAIYPSGNPPAWHDFNGSTTPEPGLIYLEGHECLVFFLGGIPSSSGVGVAGFSKLPNNPFVGDAAQPNRMQASSFEFRSDRLNDLDDGDGMPGYLDPLSSGGTPGEGNLHFYAYFSGYGQNQYDPNDVNFLEERTLQKFGNEAMWSGAPAMAGSPAPNPYTSSLPVVPGVGMVSYMNPNGFQIVSAGGDGYYGPGGQYGGESGSGDKLPLHAQYPPMSMGAESPADLRARERDNLTNFTRGRID
ncbi:MAG: hypothetical protein KatS3mg108_0948 [Isosphaeraceae bacterium]|jgi:general secretion pathway protein G|nr:MAG: hypothetical protein KatS3mg108_0948 [Isosphaeraceae bacterium]